MRKPQYGINWFKWTIQLLALATSIIFLFTDLPDRFVPGYHNIIDSVKGLDLSDTLNLVIVSLLVVFFGRLFCGFLCPLGTTQDILMALRNDFGIRQIRVSDKVGNVFRIFKYILLFCVTIVLYNDIKINFVNWMLIAAASVAGVLSLIIDRFFCKYLCPAGAGLNTFKFWLPLAAVGAAYYGLELLFKTKFPSEVTLGLFCVTGYILEITLHSSRLHLLRVVKADDRCTHCGECTRSCPYSINIKNCGNNSSDLECTLCGQCVTACRHRALGIGILTKRSQERGFTRFVPGIVVIAVVAALIVQALI